MFGVLTAVNAFKVKIIDPKESSSSISELLYNNLTYEILWSRIVVEVISCPQ